VRELGAFGEAPHDLGSFRGVRQIAGACIGRSSAARAALMARDLGRDS